MPPNTPRRSLHALPPGTVLHDYVIDSQLGSGGFSIVYLARHRLNSDWLFAIKEFLPRELAVRDNDGASVHPVDTEAKEAFEDGLRRFRDEAEQLRKFRNEPYIVSCLNYFEGNGTAYLVMDYDDGLPLSEFLRRREDAGRPFTEKDMFAVVAPLLEGLTVVHRTGVLHRDIKPGNIFVRRQDDITGRPAHPVLIDFGAAKQNYLARHSRSRAPYTPGYASYEQVSSMGEIGPWTDLYSLGAVMWRMVAGGCPDDSRLMVPDESDGMQAEKLIWSPGPREVEKRAYALNRGWANPMPPAVDLGKGRFSQTVLEAIDQCLALYPEERVQGCGELSELLGEQRSVQNLSSHAREGGSSTVDAGEGDGDKLRGTQEPTVDAKTRSADKVWGVAILIVTIGAVLILAQENTSNDRGPITPQDQAQPLVVEPELSVDTERGVPGSALTLEDSIAAFEQGDYGTALDGFRNLAEQGHTVAQAYLGYMYDRGEGVAEDDFEAVRWFRLAAEQGHAYSQYNLGAMYARGEGVSEDAVEAVRLYRLAAEQRYDLAQHNLGIMYANGEGVPEDDVEAVRWYRLAAEQGLAGAQLSLGFMYDNGEGVPEDDLEAVGWYHLAAEQGHVVAQLNLGIMYASGQGVPEDGLEAVRWYRQAAEQGHAGAQHNLGILYDNGQGVPEDDLEAVRWYRQAAEQGHAGAQHNLGIMYANGQGVPENDVEAVRWWRLASEQGTAGAQFLLGRAYALGEGVPENGAEAASLFNVAAEQGFIDAQYALGYMYSHGIGILEDVVESYAWLSLAEAQGHSDASNEKQSVAVRMSETQVQAAQELSGEYWTMYVVPFR